jgi:hypothetical protein
MVLRYKVQLLSEWRYLNKKIKKARPRVNRVPLGSTTPPVGGASIASGTRDPGPTGQGGRIHTCMHPDLRGAHRPSRTGAYKLVRTILSFRGGTKKSHSEQQARDVLMGRPIKKGSTIVNGATLQFVKPFPVALPCCTCDRWGRPVPRWQKGSSTQNGATTCKVAPLIQASQ